ncbi:hypothetical protein GCM10010359_43450 [Streptomyces morookaense]|nr:hypothetical protein GCM10010359_43450 [Streptomyces morookaense]
MEEMRLIAAGRDGRRETVVLEVEDSGTPGIKLVWADGTTTVHPDVDLFECLKAVRCALKEKGSSSAARGHAPWSSRQGRGAQCPTAGSPTPCGGIHR